MANGLRKIMRNAWNGSKKSTLTRRANRFGRRLNVQELEERIAPTAVTLAADDFATWDVSAGDGAFDASDGFIGLAGASAGIDSITVADMTDGAATDTALLNITVTDSAAGAATIIIGCSQTIGTIDLTGLHAGTTSLTLVIGSGLTTTADDPASPDQDFTVNGTAYTCTTQEATDANVGDPTIANAAEVFTGLADGGMGTITLPAIADLPITIVVVAGSVTGAQGDATGAIGAISSASTADITGATAASAIYGTSLAGLTTTGQIVSGANGVDIDIVTSIGAISLGGIEITGNGAIGIDAGTTGFTGVVGTGPISTTGAGSTGDVTINAAGSFAGAVTTGAITMAATAAATDVTITATAAAGFGGGFTAGLITMAAGNQGALTVGTATGALNAVSLAGIANSSTVDAGDASFIGLSIGNITSSAAIETVAGAAGDILFNAAGAAATGSMGDVTVTGNVAAGVAGATITFQANDDMGNIGVTGNVGGAGAVAFTADNGGTADTGNMGNITVTNGTGTAQLGNGGGAVAFAAVDIGNIVADDIGSTGAGPVTFTADGLDATDGAGGGVIGTLTVTDDVATTGAVTFTADDGMGVVVIGGDAAQGAALGFDVNNDAIDDNGAMGAITAQTLGDTVGNTTVTIDTSSSAPTNANAADRTVGDITVTDGNARLSITSASDVGAISVSGGHGALGNLLDIIKMTLNDSATLTLTPDLGAITVADTAGVADILTIDTSAWVIPGTMGAMSVGDDDAGDLLTLSVNISVYAGDLTGGAVAFSAAYASAEDNNVDISAGAYAGAGTISANTRSASDLVTFTQGTEIFQVTTASDVTAKVVVDPNGNGAADGPSVLISELAGTSGSDNLQVTSSGATAFDVAGITPAADGLNVKNITIEGQLTGDLGTAALGFGAVETIIIQGADNGNTFYGTSLMGYASTDGTLVTTGVNVLALDTLADGTEDVVLAAGSTFRFADDTGATADVFNHHIGVTVGGAAATATIRGIDGDGTLDEFSYGADNTATGVSGELLDPADLFAADAYAMISRILIDDIGGLSTDVTVLEVDGTTNGSFFEFENSVGLVNITTQIDSISVGFDDGGNLVDDVILTSISGTANTRNDFDRLGGGQASGNKAGLVGVVDNATAVLGNLIVQSIGDPGAANINIVVAGDSGPITLTGDTALLVPDHGGFVTNNGANSAAIAIGGSLQGAITIPGAITPVVGAAGMCDILIGVAIDANNDGDWLDAGDTPSGSVNAAITIGGGADTDVLVADDVDADIVVTGQDQDIEVAGIDVAGDLDGVKAGGNLNNDVIVAASLEYVIADGINAADIFSGGNGADTLEVEGTTITGSGVVGGVNGVLSLTFLDHVVVGDTPDTDAVTADAAGITLQWLAGGIGATDTLGDAYVQGAAMTTLNVTTANGDGINIGDIYFLDQLAAPLAVTSVSTIGVLVFADDVTTVPTSEALQDLITTTDVVFGSVSALDTASGDEAADLDYEGSIVAENAGGVLAEGDVLTSTVGFQAGSSLGYIVALNGFVDVVVGGVHAGVSIGDIVASTDIDGTFVSEGTLATATTDLSTTIATDYGLSGVPAWFVGGILAEAGDIGSGSNEDIDLDTGTIYTGGAPSNEAVFTATGEATLVQGSAFWTQLVMGTFYVPAGTLSADINAGGAMGGIQVPAGQVWVELTVPWEAAIARIIAPQFQDNANATVNSSWNADKVGILVIAGETVVVAGAPMDTDDLDIAVTGVDTLAIVDNTDVTMAGGLANGSSLLVDGDLNSLTFEGNWAGLVDIDGNPNDDSNGEVVTVVVNGTVEATADLEAYNFGEILADDLSAVENTGTLAGGESYNFTNLAGEAQTLYLNGGRGVAAEWTTVFGKMDQVQVYGRGAASVLSVNGTYDDAIRDDVRDLRRIERDAKSGRANVGLAIEGSAHVGTLETALGSALTLRSAVANGDLDNLNVSNNVNNLWVSGQAGDVAVGNKINKAFIAEGVGDFSARTANNVKIDGGASSVTAFRMSNSDIGGVTGALTIGSLWNNGVRIAFRGGLYNSNFENVTVITQDFIQVRSSVG